jgi:hypothetical protein
VADAAIPLLFGIQQLSLLINEEVTYRTNDAKVKEHYKFIAMDLSRMLPVPFKIVVVNDDKKSFPRLSHPALRCGLRPPSSSVDCGANSLTAAPEAPLACCDSF